MARACTKDPVRKDALRSYYFKENKVANEVLAGQEIDGRKMWKKIRAG